VIRSLAYEPQELSVPAGTAVTWTNNDEVAHTVTADDRAYDSGLIAKGQTFAHTYTAAGRYGYFCIPHGSPGSGQFGAVSVT
jgi:plastocyanin